MKRAALILVAALSRVCAGAIGDMLMGDVSSYPQKYCNGGPAFDPEGGGVLLKAGARFNALHNFPVIFHGLMCQLSHYCLPEYDPGDWNMQFTEFPGCATPADREKAARTLYPTITNRNNAVGQLVPFFNAGGPTNVGVITIGPLMHAYGGSPLCVWPASNVVNVSAGYVPLDPVPGAAPLRAGVGRGGCFNTAAWLMCTDFADMPQGFHTSMNPFGDLGGFFAATLEPHFSIDWASNGIPTYVSQYCDNSYFLTNSPNYVSAEAVPTRTASPVLTIEPWRRSWEAVGGLDLFTWHTNTNVFEYAATNVWHLGTLSASSSNAFVSAMKRFLGDGHPALSNREYFPANGLSVTKSQWYGPQGYNGDSVRPNDYYDPTFIILPRGIRSTPPAYFPAELTYTWTVTNINAGTLSAPVSNYVHGVTNTLKATSVKYWHFRKINEQGGARYPITNDTVVADFGWGQHEYSYETYVLGPTSYDWEMTSEDKPDTRVEFSSVSNYMRTVCRAHMVADSVWPGLTDLHYADPSRASSVCRYNDDGVGTVYFLSGSGNSWEGEAASSMFNFMEALVTYDDPDEAGKWWEDIIQKNAAGEIVFKIHQPMPWGFPEIETDDGTGYIPTDEADAKSEITYTIDNWLEMFYEVKWDPVRAWGIFQGVTNHADWPQ